MNFRARPREEPDINLTPLIDVVFLLLIFFMVSTTFNREAELNIQLPEAEGETREEPAQVVDITIDTEGRYFVNRQEVINRRVETLQRAIEQAAEGEGERPVIISADGRAPHQSVIRALDAARRAGLYSITFATREPPKEE